MQNCGEETKRKQLREKFILETANLLGVPSENYDDLPEKVKEFYSCFSYVDIITPLVIHDRISHELSYGQLAFKYRVTKAIIQYIFCCKKNYGK